MFAHFVIMIKIEMTHIVKHNLLVAKGRVSLKHLVQDRRSIEIQLSYIHSLLYFALLKSNDSINFFGSCYKYYPSSPLRALGLSSELLLRVKSPIIFLTDPNESNP